MTSFGPNLILLREKAGLTQNALAVRAGMCPSQVARIENGTWEPRWGTVQKLCAALRCKPNAFYNKTA
jgi:transcriptional regulator with XRE-family HTH domain